MSDEELITKSLTLPGDAETLVIRRRLLPAIPDEVRAWADGDGLPGLYIKGPSGSGKTWVAAWAAAQRSTAPRFWSEDRFIRDLERLRWYERVVATQRHTPDEQWSEYSEYERAFERLRRSEVLVFDDVLLWGVLEYQREEMVKIIRHRLKHGMLTIVCSKAKPEAGTPFYDCLAMCEEVSLAGR